MAVVDIQCPAGLEGKIRGLKVTEQKILTNRGLARRGMMQESLIEACWLETLNPGIYEPKPDGSVDWAKVLQAERFYAFMHVVIATYGPIWEFVRPCDYCKAKMTIPVHLEKDLKVKPVPESTKEALLRGENRFETVIPGTDRKVWFRLLTGVEERRIPRMQEDMEDELISATLAMRIIEIEGVKPEKKIQFIKDLGLGEATGLQDAFEEPDGGVDTAIDCACSRCKAEQEVDVPFDISFVLRGGGRGRRKRRRKSARKR